MVNVLQQFFVPIDSVCCMTYPRSHLVDPAGGNYHVCARCVRRAYLCGVDKISGRDFSHRRKWIERRILELGEIFTVSIYAYAVMTNHYHIVLRVEPRPLTDVEVVDRWLLLCPVTAVNTSQQYCHEARKFAILADQEKLAELRLRLCSLSWFMRFLNEPLARMANSEDRCKGRFWEGRFKSQHLLDEAAVLACMVYVDLNPIRAGIATTPADSNFTSLQRRIRDNKINVFSQPIKAANSSRSPLPFEPLSLGDYLHLVRWTQGSQSTRKRSIPFGVSYSLLCNHTDSDQWFRDHLPCPGEWPRALGSIDALKEHARELGQCWIKRRRRTVDK
jgi:REP element-mobilizing transposase RayT